MSSGDRLKQLRMHLGLPKFSFGVRIGMTQKEVTAAEKGRCEIGEETIRKVSRIFGVSEAWLRDGDEQTPDGASAGAAAVKAPAAKPKPAGARKRTVDPGAGRRMRMLRMSMKLTQDEFANRIGVQKTLISRFENGRRAVPEKTVNAVCSVFGVSAEWLVAGVGAVTGMEPGFADLAVLFGLGPQDAQMPDACLGLADEGRGEVRRATFEAAVNARPEYAHGAGEPVVSGGRVERFDPLVHAAPGEDAGETGLKFCRTLPGELRDIACRLERSESFDARTLVEIASCLSGAFVPAAADSGGA